VFDSALIADARRLIATLEARELMLATAESCTGGLVSGLLTSVPGSSAVVERGFVTYSNAAKSDLLGVDPELIERHGAVSEEVARAMAAGALVRSDADVAVSVTGIAGPSGGSAEKPVGLVHLAVARIDGPTLHIERRYGARDRQAIRLAAVEDAVLLALEALEPQSSPATESQG
jgi:nicotinamide-nucleotide amidase